MSNCNPQDYTLVRMEFHESCGDEETSFKKSLNTQHNLYNLAELFYWFLVSMSYTYVTGITIHKEGGGKQEFFF